MGCPGKEPTGAEQSARKGNKFGAKAAFNKSRPGRATWWLRHQNFYGGREESETEFSLFDHSLWIGTQDPNCWEHDRHTISHVLIVRISSDESDALQATSRTHARWGLGELKSRYLKVSPEGVVPLASGYVEGASRWPHLSTKAYSANDS